MPASTATDTTPVTTDATDPATIAKNSSGGRSVPGDMPADLALLFAGTDFDPNATITKANLRKNTAGKGRQSKPLDDRSVKFLTTNLALIVSDAGNDEGATFGFLAFPKHEEFVGYKSKVTNWIKDNNESGTAVKVSFGKHPQSPVGYDTKKTEENKGKSMIYAITLSRGEQETEEASE